MKKLGIGLLLLGALILVTVFSVNTLTIGGVIRYQAPTSFEDMRCGTDSWSNNSPPAGYLIGDEVTIIKKGFFDARCFGQDLVSGYAEDMQNHTIVWQPKDYYGLADGGAYLRATRCQADCSGSGCNDGSWDCLPRTIPDSCKYVGLYDTLKQKIVGYLDIKNPSFGEKAFIKNLDGTNFSQSWGTYQLVCLDSQRKQASNDYGKTFQLFTSTDICRQVGTNNYVLITQPFSAGTELSLDALSQTPEAFCLEAPAQHLDLEERILEQTITPYKQITSAQTVTVPQGQVIKISYVAKVSDAGQICSPEEALNPITSECIPVAFIYNCVSGGSWDNSLKACKATAETMTFCVDKQGNPMPDAVYIEEENICANYVSESEIRCEDPELVYEPSISKCVKYVSEAELICPNGTTKVDEKCYNTVQKIYDDSLGWICPSNSFELNNDCLKFAKYAELQCISQQGGELVIIDDKCYEKITPSDFICPTGSTKTENGCVEYYTPSKVPVCNEGSYDKKLDKCVYTPEVIMQDIEQKATNFLFTPTGIAVIILAIVLIIVGGLLWAKD